LPHSKQVRPSKAAHAGLCPGYELCQPIHHAITPFRSFNFAADDSANFPLEINQLGVNGVEGSLACGSYQLQDLRENFFVLSYWLQIGRIQIIWLHTQAFQS
jgi:hypothetical protein